MVKLRGIKGIEVLSETNETEQFHRLKAPR